MNTATFAVLLVSIVPVTLNLAKEVPTPKSAPVFSAVQFVAKVGFASSFHVATTSDVTESAVPSHASI